MKCYEWKYLTYLRKRGKIKYSNYKYQIFNLFIVILLPSVNKHAGKIGAN